MQSKLELSDATTMLFWLMKRNVEEKKCAWTKVEKIFEQVFLSKLCHPEPEFRAKRSVSGWLRWDISFLPVETRCLYSLPEELIRCHLFFHSVHFIVHFDMDFSIWSCSVLLIFLAEGCTFYFTLPLFFLTMDKTRWLWQMKEKKKKPLDKDKGQKYLLDVFNKFLFCECCVIKRPAPILPWMQDSEALSKSIFWTLTPLGTLPSLIVAMYSFVS